MNDRDRQGSPSVILGVMLANRRVVGACVVIVALLVVGCSSGGGNRSSSTTIASATTNTSTSRRVAKLGPCPKQYPNTPLNKLNTGVRGLDKKLVPISAATVRICKWGARDVHTSSGEQTVPDKLVGFATLTSRRASVFEDLTNHQPNGQAGPIGCTGPNGGIGYEFLRLTFANGSDRIDVEEDDGPCAGPQLSNGKFFAVPGLAWLTDVLDLTRGTPGTVVGTIREVGGPGPLNRQIPGTVIAANASGTYWQGTTTATKPFSMTLPAGTYRLTGSSPIVNSGQVDCFAPAPVIVVGGKTTRVEVVCSIR